MDTLLVLSYIAPVCGIIGFIITPGLTIIRPWIMDKLRGEKKRELKNFNDMKPPELYVELLRFEKTHKWDWRPNTFKQRKKLRKALSDKLLNHACGECKEENCELKEN